jgi:single-strand DNA-binding protein
MSVANVTITGRLARDPESSTTSSGTSMVKLTIPVNNRRTDSTTWWTATLFGKAGDAAARFLRKGSWVCVSGEAHVRTYDKRDGSTGVSAEVDNARFNFVGPKQDDGHAQHTEQPADNGHRRAAMSGDMNDLPF